MEPLQRHPTFDVVDSSKLQTFMDCPRKAFFEYCLGWVPDRSMHDLHFGISIHEAMEVIMNHRKDATSRGYPFEVIEEAINAFRSKYREVYPDAMMDELYEPKTIQNVIEILELYAGHYAADNFQTIHTETSGSISVGPYRMYFRSDAFVRTQRGHIEVWDHKSTAWNVNMWSSTFNLSIQLGCYLHVAKSIYGDDVSQAIINGLLFRKPLKNGTQKHELLRIPVTKDDLKMQDWYETVLHYLDSYFEELEKALNTDPEDPIMSAFPKQPGSCLKFNRLCPYHDFCCAWTNPISSSQQYGLPGNYRQRYWDPRDLDKESTHKVEA